jgi:hypothetical protein
VQFISLLNSITQIIYFKAMLKIILLRAKKDVYFAPNFAVGLFVLRF